jgi:hypothetical protein
MLFFISQGPDWDRHPIQQQVHSKKRKYMSESALGGVGGTPAWEGELCEAELGGKRRSLQGVESASAGSDFLLQLHS